MTVLGYYGSRYAPEYPKGWRHDLEDHLCPTCAQEDYYMSTRSGKAFGSLYRQVSQQSDFYAGASGSGFESEDASSDDVEVVLEEKKLSMWFTPPSRKWQDVKVKQLGMVVKKSVPYQSPELIWRMQKPTHTVKTVGDGNCFFRALSYVITGTHELHLTLRAIIVQVILESPKLFQNLTSIKPHEYIKESEMSKDKTWASEVEIFAAATLLNTPIAVYARYGAKDEWLIYKPLGVPAGKEYSEKDTMIYLSNLCSHFEPVLEV